MQKYKNLKNQINPRNVILTTLLVFIASALFAIEIEVVQPVSCSGQDAGQNGILKVKASGAFAPGTEFSWEPSGGNTQEVSNLPVGNYSVTVTDPDGCTAEASIELENEIEVTVSGQSFRVCEEPCPDPCTPAGPPCPQAEPFTCKVTLTANVENCPDCEITWSNGETGNSIEVESSGTYTATATTPNNECTASGSKSVTIEITEPDNCIDDDGCVIIWYGPCPGPCEPPPPPPPPSSSNPCAPDCPQDLCYTCKKRDGPCIRGIASSDPNDIIGPDGYEGWVSVKDNINYLIRYENDPIVATAAAQIVRIVHPIAEELNIFNFRISQFGFGQFVFEVPNNTIHYSTQLDVSDELGVLVNVLAGIDVVKREAFWIFESFDPVTGLEPEPGVGFLPINDTLLSDPDNFIYGPGEGFVTFTIRPDANVAETYDTIIALADIFFDQNEAVRTPDWINIIDADAPVSSVDFTNVALDSPEFVISWSASDYGVGLSHVELYLSVNNAPFELLTDTLTGDSLNYTGSHGSSYAFYTRGVDLVGNKEPAKQNPEATFFINGRLELLEPALTEACAGQEIPVSWTYLGLQQLDILLAHETGDSSLLYILQEGWNVADSSTFVTIPSNLTASGNYYIILQGINSFLADTSQAIDIDPIIMTPDTDLFTCRNDTFYLHPHLGLSGGFDSLSFVWSGQNIGDPNQFETYALPTFSQYYTLSVTDARGCVSLDSIFLHVFQPPAIVTQKNDILCAGSATGEITLVMSGEEPFNITWNDGVIGQTYRQNLPAGEYSVTVIDGNGCVRSRDISVFDIYPFSYEAGGLIYRCPGDSIELGSGPELLGGASPHQFQWTSTDPAFTDSAILNPVVTPMEDQIYVLEIIDSVGCVFIDTAIVVNKDLPEFTADLTHVTCFGAGDGTIAIQPQTSDGPWTYLWSNLDTTAVRENLNPLDYSVTVTNAFGCSSIDSFEINSPSLLVAGLQEFIKICPGDTVQLFSSQSGILGGTPPFTFDWGPENSLISSGNQFAYAAPTADSTLFTLEVTDANNCTSTAETWVILRSAPTLTASITDLPCTGEPEGSIELTPGGTPPFGITWFDGDSSLLKTNLSAGIYTVTITDDLQFNDQGLCANTYTFEVQETASDDTLAVFTTTCNEADTGFYYLSLTNQFGCDSVVAMTVYFAETDSIFFFETTCVASEAGLFVEQLTNQFGCDSIVTTTIDLAQSYEIFLSDFVCDQSDAGTFVQNLTTQLGCDSIVTTTLSWAGDSMEISAVSCVQADAGISTETYINQAGCDSVVITTTTFDPAWETAETLFTCFEGETGVFELVLTAVDGCDSLVTQTVQLFEIEDAEINNLNTTYCENATTVSLTVSPSGGTLSGPGVSGLIFDPQAAGTGVHTLVYEAVDINGCVVSTEETVEVLEVPEVSVSLGNEAYCPYTTQVDIITSPAGGTVTGTSVDGLVFNPSQAGPGNFAIIYFYEDANGCSATDTFNVEVHEPTQSELSGLSETFCDNDPVAQISPSPAGGTLSGPGVTNLNFNPANANVGINELSYEFTDAFGCTYTDIHEVEVFEAPIVNLGADTTITEGDSLLLDAGNPGAWYLWTTTETTQQIFISETGTYGVTVTDDNGCSNFDDVTVEVLVWVNDPDLLNAITIFPNPTTGLFNISFESDRARRVQIEIFDPTGRRVSYQSVIFNAPGEYNVPCDIGSMPSGSYFIRITADDTHVNTQPILKVND
jgi:hypothetical protein